MTTTEVAGQVGRRVVARRVVHGAAGLSGAVALLLLLVLDVRYYGGAAAGPPGELTLTEVGTMVAANVAVFSIDTVVLITAAGALVALRPESDSLALRWLHLAALLSTVLTVVVYQVTTSAEEKFGKVGLVFAWDLLSHYVAPALLLLGWLLTGPRRRFDVRLLGLVLLWPVGWLAYMLVFARLVGLYPYDFLDPGLIGNTGVVLVSLVLFLASMAVGGLLLLLDRRLPPVPRRDSATAL